MKNRKSVYFHELFREKAIFTRTKFSFSMRKNLLPSIVPIQPGFKESFQGSMDSAQLLKLKETLVSMNQKFFEE